MHLKALFEFLSELEQNNNRPWFAWNKPAYDVLREEFEHLVADVTARVQKFDRALGPVDPKKAMFRIYRDTRFSKDRTPYKTHFSAAIRDRSKRGLEPGYYFHIDHKGMLLVGGARFRKTYDGFIDEDALVRPPKGFSVDTPHIDAIKLRHFFAMLEVNVKRRPPKDLAGDLADDFRDLLPLMEWLRAAASTERGR